MNRINIGGCDFSMRGYTYVDTVGDVALDSFALQEEDIDMKVMVFIHLQGINLILILMYIKCY